MVEERKLYGSGDATFQAVGGEVGVRKLVDTFYDIMSEKEEYRRIWDWHPEDKQRSRDKLFYFLCGWMGGPSNYAQHFGPINIPRSHMHLSVTKIERNMWLNCMHDAMNQLEFPESLIDYLLKQLSIPAERIRQTSRAS